MSSQGLDLTRAAGVGCIGSDAMRNEDPARAALLFV